MNLCVCFIAVPEGRNIALADSAVIAPEDLHATASPKPILTDLGLSTIPKSNRFIGLLVAYILITLLVVYMVVCAVCFQPQKCLSLIGRGSEEVTSSRSSHRRWFNMKWLRRRQSETPSNGVPLVLPRTNPHFSRSVDGERFLHYPLQYRQASASPACLVNLQEHSQWLGPSLPQVQMTDAPPPYPPMSYHAAC